MLTTWLWQSMAGISGSAVAVAQGIKLSSWGIKQHMAAIGLVLVLSVISGYLLSQNTDARTFILIHLPLGSVITTSWWRAKVLENWLYWIVIDAVSIFLYLDRELYQTVGHIVYTLYWQLLAMSLGEKPISNKVQNQAKHYLQNWRQWQAPFQTQPQIVKQLEGGLPQIPIIWLKQVLIARFCVLITRMRLSLASIVKQKSTVLKITGH